MSAARTFSEGLQETGRAVKDALSAARASSASLICTIPAGVVISGPDAAHYASSAAAAESGSPLMRRSVEDSASLLSDSIVCKAVTTIAPLHGPAVQTGSISNPQTPGAYQPHCVVRPGNADAPTPVNTPHQLPTSPRCTATAASVFSRDEPQPTRTPTPYPVSSLSSPSWTPSSRHTQTSFELEAAARCGCSCLRGSKHANAAVAKDPAACNAGHPNRDGTVLAGSGGMSGLRWLRIEASNNPQVSPRRCTHNALT